jgi:hypothetical protein
MAEGVASLRAMLGRALERLSAGLYANRNRFVAELIQNADDCKYKPGVEPTLLLVVGAAGWVVSAHNEIGFSATDVWALCDVGASTKKTGEAIGHKGIGFKSVFMVSNTPHVLSNDFAFRFDVDRHGLFGYVVPEWVPPPTLRAQLTAALYPPGGPTLPPPAGLSGPEGGGTWLYLPLKPDTRVSLPGASEDRVGGGGGGGDGVLPPLTVPAAAMLFLRRLKRCVVHDQRVQCSTTLSCQDDGDGCQNGDQKTAHPAGTRIVTITQVDEHLSQVDQSGGQDGDSKAVVRSETTHTFVVYREKLTVPKNLMEGRDGADTSELVLAFPWPPLRAPQDVYTFLPVCSAGLPFLLHAEFTLVASRGEVRSDCAWNQWLRQKAAKAFSAAVASDPQLRNHLPAILPCEAEVTAPFWRPLVVQILHHLGSLACLRSEGATWRCPQDLRLRPRGAGSHLLTNHELERACQVEFVDPKVGEALLQSPGAAALWVQPLSVGELLRTIHHLRIESDAASVPFVPTSDPCIPTCSPCVVPLVDRPGSWWVSLYVHLDAVATAEDVAACMRAPLFVVHGGGTAPQGEIFDIPTRLIIKPGITLD